MSGVTIGGTTPGAGNVISGNTNGISLVSDSGIAVEGNFIGTDPTGTLLLGNSGYGVFINESSDNVIGGTVPGAGNVIAGNGSGGVDVDGSSTGDAILANSIYANGAALIAGTTGGIDLGGNATIPNTPGGPHVGPNDLQNFPILASATPGTGSTTITGTLNSTPNTAFTVQFFASAAADPSGFGEGQTYLGQVTGVMTDGSGNASFTAVVGSEPSGQAVITATATDPAGNTSEFSKDLLPVTAFTVTNTEDSGSGSLRQAILNANASGVLQTINFQIPGPGVHTIAPASRLPALTDPVLIDGYTQPGASPDTLTGGDNAVLNIVLSGTAAGLGAAFGLHITGGGSTVRGLVIDGFGSGSTGDGILIDTRGGNTITGNAIGTDPTGTQPFGNGSSGIDVESSGNTDRGGTAAST